MASKHCPVCGQEILAGLLECPNCGAPVEMDNVNPEKSRGHPNTIRGKAAVNSDARVVDELIKLAGKLQDEGNPEAALTTYRHALTLSSGTQAMLLQATIQALEKAGVKPPQNHLLQDPASVVAHDSPGPAVEEAKLPVPTSVTPRIDKFAWEWFIWWGLASLAPWGFVDWIVSAWYSGNWLRYHHWNRLDESSWIFPMGIFLASVAQYFLLRRHLPKAMLWLIASSLAATLYWLMISFIQDVGFFGVLEITLLGMGLGLFVGIAQMLVLSRSLQNTHHWLVVSVVSWAAVWFGLSIQEIEWGMLSVSLNMAFLVFPHAALMLWLLKRKLPPRQA
jgi:hypothetical protein